MALDSKDWKWGMKYTLFFHGKRVIKKSYFFSGLKTLLGAN